jgi:hypothetical protein
VDKADVVTIGAIAAGAYVWLAALFAKLSTLDVKVDLLSRGGKSASMDVIIGGRRKTDPPMPPAGPVPTVLPVDRRD